MRIGRMAILIVSCLLLLVSCGSQKTFNATVMSNSNGILLIQPDQTATESKSSDRIAVNTDGILVQDAEGTVYAGDDIQEGARLKIYYDGTIMESYPAQLGNLEKIVLLDRS